MNPATTADELGLQLAEEMSARWGRGERPTTEDYLARHPELLGQPDGALNLVYEEYCLCRRYGPQTTVEDLCQRFPQWREPLRLLLDCHELLEDDPPPVRFPAVGEVLGDYRLVAEMGRGARGRVFMATQVSLADRPVVLKVTPRDGDEHLSLARLQHTNLVPLYAAHDHAERGLRVLCLPYFGGATLADLLADLATVAPRDRSGAVLLAALDRHSAARPVTIRNLGPARQLLAGLSYVQAVCWLGAVLADALEYAHERGLVHLDVKPSNLLLAADGQPMLLDFHLAREPLRAGQATPDILGGTPAYQPPEQTAALEAVAFGRPLAADVDGRADVYALGGVLYEALAGVPWIPGRSLPLHRIHPEVGRALSDLVAKCLKSDPAHRLASAGVLAADLRHHLADRPLRSVRNGSMAERWQKWRRRRPAALALTFLGVALLVALGGGAAAAWAEWRHRVADAEQALDEGRRQGRERGHHDEAVETLRYGLQHVEVLPGCAELAERLRHELQEAEAAQLAAQRTAAIRALHGLVARLRAAYGVDPPRGDGLDRLDEGCGRLWAQRGVLSAAGTADLVDLAVLWADLRVRGRRTTAARREALTILDQAEALGGKSAVLAVERRRQQRALGLPESLDADPAPQTAWEHYALARGWLREGDRVQAGTALAQALLQEPHHPWSNFTYGQWALQSGHPEDAVTAFSVCIGAMPDAASVYYHRAMAHAALGRGEQARRGYDQALRLDPHFAVAALNRGVLHYEAGRHEEASIDLERALADGAPPCAACYNLALVRLAQGRRAEAADWVGRTLAHEPGHEGAQRLREGASK